MKKYDALLILDIQGREENVNDVIEEVEKEIKALSGRLIGTQKMDRRRFESVAGRLDSGFYLGVVFELDPKKVESLQSKFRLNAKIYRQFFLRSETVKKEKAVVAA